MQQNCFVVSTKYLAISIKFWLLKKNVFPGNKKSLVAYIFFSVLYKQYIHIITSVYKRLPSQLNFQN